MVERDSDAVRDVLAERHRQIVDEGFTPEHDDQHVNGEMGDAAACYAMSVRARNVPRTGEIWPWFESWWKPNTSDRREDLIKAGALVIAEIERIDRARAEWKNPPLRVVSELAPGFCSSINPCSHQCRDPTTICRICTTASELARSASAA